MDRVRRSLRAAVLMGAAVSVMVFTVGANAQNQNSNSNQWPYGNPTPDNTWPYATIGRSPVLAVVGDVACQPGETEPAGEKAGENCVGDTAQSLTASQAAPAEQIETIKLTLCGRGGVVQ